MSTSPSSAYRRHRIGVRVALFLAIAVVCLSIGSISAAIAAPVRLKDIVDFEGVRDNLLVGYGLVVGLNGTGDTLSNSPFTEQSLAAILERLGVNTRIRNADPNDFPTRLTTINTRNVAAVFVTATLPPYAAQGTRIDVNASALGDASSLLGGTLLVTPLLAADGEVYAVAQGSMTIGGFSAEGAAQTTVKNVPTAGRIANGAIVEREIPFSLSDLQSIRMSLRNPDFTTSTRIARAINAELGGPFATATDPASVRLAVPPRFGNDVVALVTRIEHLQIEPDQVARVVIDERTGVVVMGENVRISTVAVAQGNLTVKITETPQVSQPTAFSGGDTVVVPRTDIEVDEDEDRRLGIVRDGVSLQELVQNLNALGVGPRDMISILQAIKAAGALQADIEVL